MKPEKENSVIVNLIGTGCKICIIPHDKDLFSKLHATATKLHLPLETAILDVDFFKHLGEGGIKDITAMSQKIIRGLLFNPTAQIEIRSGGKKKDLIERDPQSNRISLNLPNRHATTTTDQSW